MQKSERKARRLIESADGHFGLWGPDNPSVDNPSVVNPSVDNPSVVNLSVDNPSVDNPSVVNPSVDNPPVDNPSVVNPSVDNPSVKDNPARSIVVIHHCGISLMFFDVNRKSPPTTNTILRSLDCHLKKRGKYLAAD
ncbi:hypothetical protein niasHT_002977 [Heterodera trifolii]|uniref:Uncharacterized protein n=1 Tax=Heterodera trifolii TaxID=157864 RepID=A0ABD2LP43_9BILA